MKRSVLDYLENTAKRCPERLAWDASAPFTFGQWWDAAQRIASSLSSRCARNTPVAVLMNPRSAECVKVFFGVWAAGCFYAPLDPMLPPERLKLIMQNLQPTAIVYDEESRAKAEAVCPDGCECVLWSDAAQSPVDADKLVQIRQTVTPDHLAAILYTSGSTGIPKGVAHTQGSLMAYTEETIERYQFTENTVFGNQSPFFYANSIIDIFPPALLGAKACMIPATALSFPKTLVNYLRQKGITELTMTPSSFVQVANNGLLPLAKGTKVYIEASASDTLDHYKTYLNNFGTVVENLEDADVAIGYFNSVDDAAELFVEDAQDAGKPIILTMVNKVTEYELKNANAVMYIPYSQKPDHGTGEAGFIYGTEPWIYADLIFGERQPEGIIQKEQARDSWSDAAQWKDLAGDQGASNYVRLLVQALMEDDPNHASPNNFGDPLVVYNYSMRYGQKGDFQYSCLILPSVYAEQETTNSRGQTVKSVVGTVSAKAGEEFMVYCLLRNNGADDLTYVQVKDGDEVVAEKLYTVCGGSWRVVEIPVTIATPGEHTITVGTQSGTITIAE